MHFYVIMRRETGRYVTEDPIETIFIPLAKKYTSRKQALDNLTPNTCVCGPYSTDDYGGQPG